MSDLRRAAAAALASLLVIQAAGAQEPASASEVPPSLSFAAVSAPERVGIPVKDAGAFGFAIEMATEVYKPNGAPPYPVVIFSHGRAGDAYTRSKLVHPVSAEQVRYWLDHGFAVVAPIRPGYGRTGGADAEASGSNAECTHRPDYRKVAEAGKRALTAAIDWVEAQPWADAREVILVGQSVGGLVTVATSAAPLPGVVAYVNFAGGSGGDPEHSPGRSCAPELLTDLYAEWGKTTSIPNLWMYAQNDQYWGPTVPATWHEAFARDSNSHSTFVHTQSVADGDGHGLSRHARQLWAPDLDRFLESLPASESGR